MLPMIGRVDAVVTDPPYPNEYVKEYKYESGLIESIHISRGLVFWTSRCPFPLKHSTLHVWDKKIGIGMDFELIYEINGNGKSCMFRHYLINSSVAAMMTRDVLTGHPSQKPIGLMLELVNRTRGETILDPFMGSGTTGVACVDLGRSFIGIECQPKYFDIAVRRISEALKRPRLPFEEPRKAVQAEMPL